MTSTKNFKENLIRKRTNRRQEIMNREIERDIFLFKKGYKKSVLTDNNQQDLLSTYPYLSLSNNVIFFQNENLKEEFSERILNENLHKIIGEFLGFPPSAVEFFKEVTLEDKRLINFYGIQFTTHKNDVENSLNWLKTNLWFAEEDKTVITIKKFKKSSVLRNKNTCLIFSTR